MAKSIDFPFRLTKKLDGVQFNSEGLNVVDYRKTTLGFFLQTFAAQPRASLNQAHNFMVPPLAQRIITVSDLEIRNPSDCLNPATL
jgi:hypothetical protein